MYHVVNAMTRRALLAIGAGSLAASRLRAAELDGFYYRDYSRCFPEYLAALARGAYDARNHALARIVDRSTAEARQRWARETFWKLVGGEPERTPLNARMTGSFERPGYRVEKIIYESRPGLIVSANLYTPTSGRPPYPAVLFQMGHSTRGKAYGPYQQCCQGLARLGYIVLAFDPMGQGERIAYLDAAGQDSRVGADEEHSIPGKQMLLLGDTASRYQVWDAIRSLDYLASHPLVDAKRIGSTGQSGGGTLTMLLACVDDRLSAAVVSSGNTENFACADFDPPGSTDDAEQDFIGSGAAAFDRWDLLYPLAPKPLMICVSAHDFFGTYSPRYLASGREEYEKLARVYEILGHPERLAWRATPLPHGLSYGLRLDVYNWFERWLKNSDHRIEQEPEAEPEPERTLWVGATGNVTRDFRSLRPFDLIASKAREIKPASGGGWREAMGIKLPPRGENFKLLARTRSGPVTINALEVRSGEHVDLPVWEYVPESIVAAQATYLILDDAGRNARPIEDGMCHKLARTGALVYAADLRGIGDLRPEAGRGNAGYEIRHDSEEDYAWASLILGKSLLAQRIEDILSLVNSLPGRGRFILAARGRLTVPALFAFALTRVDSLYLAGGLVSYRNLLETENYRQTLANFAWDLFRHTDLPQLAAACAPRRVQIAGAVDAAGNRMAESAVRDIYPSANVTIHADAKWDENALAAL